MTQSQGTLRKQARKLATELRERYGSDITPAQREACRRAAELTVLASSLRGTGLDGGCDLAELNRIEAMAAEAVAALPLPLSSQCTRIEVELVPSQHQWAELKDEVARLAAENGILRAGMPRQALEMPAHAPEGENCTLPHPTTDSANWPLKAPDVVPAPPSGPLSEDQRRERMARNRQAALASAPIVDQGAAQRYAALAVDPDNPLGRSRYERFDFPKSGNW